jgi:predicted SAM-dependent methyltransferase
VDSPAAQEELVRYLARGEDSPPSSSWAKRAPKALLPASLHGVALAALTRVLAPRERRRAQRIAETTSSPLRLHLGAGGSPKPGWTNVDLAGHPVELAWDLTRPLPFADASVEAVFHEHMLEHLTLDQAYGLTRECHRVLVPGGLLRVVVPDAGAYARSYANGGAGLITDYRSGRPTAMLALQEVFYLHGHRSAWDEETLSLLVSAAGFTDWSSSSYGQSRLDPVPDTEARRAESLYFEAIK